MTVRIHKGVSYSRRPLQCPGDVTYRTDKNCFSELILQNKATVADKCNRYITLQFLNQCTFSARNCRLSPCLQFYPCLASAITLRAPFLQDRTHSPIKVCSPKIYTLAKPSCIQTTFLFPLLIPQSFLIFQHTFNRAKEITTATIWWGLVNDPS